MIPIRGISVWLDDHLTLEIHIKRSTTWHTHSIHTSGRLHAVNVSGMSEGDPLPTAKRIGWLKTSESEGCKCPDEDFREKERTEFVEPRRWDGTWTGFNTYVIIWSLSGNSVAEIHPLSSLREDFSACEVFCFDSSTAESHHFFQCGVFSPC